MAKLLHLVAKALPGLRPFDDRAAAWWFWRRLRRAWPDAIAACLMPDHVHLIVPGRARDACATPGAIASGFTRHCGMPRIWLDIPLPETIPDAKHLMRQVRYLHLNPCRARLVGDPLAWPRSTHRGVIGAELDPWVPASRLAAALRCSERDFAARFHAYVSGDPSAEVSGTPLPNAAPSQAWPTLPLDTIISAALSATPWSSRAARRRTAALLAREQGWSDSRIVAKALGVDPDTVPRLAAPALRVLLVPARLCLDDPRLQFSARDASPLRASLVRQRRHRPPFMPVERSPTPIFRGT